MYGVVKFAMSSGRMCDPFGVNWHVIMGFYRGVTPKESLIVGMCHGVVQK